MSLSDPGYIGFLAAVFVLFYLLPAGMLRLALLVAASLGFYITLAQGYALILIMVVTVAFAGGTLLDRYPDSRRRRLIFVAVLVAAFAPLFFFKYLAFLFTALGRHPPSHLAKLALPVGISFFTFAAVGYLIDVYLTIIEPERNPMRLALFIAFFPLVTAGPIERGERILPQLALDLSFSSERALAGLRLIS